MQTTTRNRPLADVTHLVNDTIKSDTAFAKTIITWHLQFGRKNLPWQYTNNPYHVWVSEVMLQQTQVKTVLQYYPRFIAAFPSIQALAQSSWDEVAVLWAGLGYYQRARNMHRAAQQLIAAGQHTLPNTLDGLMVLSGIGQSTAGAILALGFHQFGVILDGNVKRSLCRYFGIADDISKTATTKVLWQLATQLTPNDQAGVYAQAMMDFGAILCTPKKPQCNICPLNHNCVAFNTQQVEKLPYKAAKAPSKQQYVVMLLWQKNTQHQHKTVNEQLWQQQPSQGIWGGLWSWPFKVFDSVEQMQLWSNQHNLTELNFLAHKKHQFTHLTWHIHLLDVSHLLDDNLIEQHNAFWFSFSEINNLAKPAPIKHLWQRLYEQ